VGSLRYVFKLPHPHQSRPERDHPDQSAIVPTRFDPLQHPAATLTGNRQAGSAIVPPGDDDQWDRL
jgi:hypothetical protein